MLHDQLSRRFLEPLPFIKFPCRKPVWPVDVVKHAGRAAVDTFAPRFVRAQS